MSIENKLNLKILLILTVLLSIVIPFFHLSPILIILLVVLIYTTAILFGWPKYGFFMLLLVRPCLDIFTNENLLNIFGFSLNFSSILAVITIGFTLFVFFKYRSALKALPLKWFILIYLFINILSIFYSFNHGLSLFESLRLISIFCVFYLAFYFIKNKTDLKNLIFIGIFSALIPSLLAFYQYFTKTGISLPFEGIYNRIFGTFAHPNLFAYFLIIPIALLFYQLYTNKLKKVTDVLNYPLIALYGLILILTFTRGAWLAVMLVILIIGIIKYRKLLVIALIAIIGLYLFVTPIQSRVNNLFSNPYSSISWRINLWQDSIGYAKEKLLLGQGAGTAKEFILDKRGEEMGSSDPHNDYLKIFLETGMIGLISYLALIFMIFFNLLKIFIYTNDAKFKVLILFTIGITFSFYTMSFADNILRNTALQWLYWSLLGGVFANYYKNKVI